MQKHPDNRFGLAQSVAEIGHHLLRPSMTIGCTCACTKSPRLHTPGHLTEFNMQRQGVVVIRTSASDHLGLPKLLKTSQNRQPKPFAVWEDSRACKQHRFEVVYLIYLSGFSSHLLNQPGLYCLGMFRSSLKFLSGRCLCLCQSLTADDIAGARPESVPHSIAQIASVNVETLKR